MNVSTLQTRNTTPTPSATAILALQPPRREHRERDFGIGYGSSSGYATHRRYATHWGEPRFRCA